MTTPARSKKECSRCHRLLPLTDFHVNRRSPDGRSGVCSECTRKRRLEAARRMAQRDSAAAAGKPSEGSCAECARFPICPVDFSVSHGFPCPSFRRRKEKP